MSTMNRRAAVCCAWSVSAGVTWPTSDARTPPPTWLSPSDWASAASSGEDGDGVWIGEPPVNRGRRSKADRPFPIRGTFEARTPAGRWELELVHRDLPD